MIVEVWDGRMMMMEGKEIWGRSAAKQLYRCGYTTPRGGHYAQVSKQGVSNNIWTCICPKAYWLRLLVSSLSISPVPHPSCWQNACADSETDEVFNVIVVASILNWLQPRLQVSMLPLKSWKNHKRANGSWPFRAAPRLLTLIHEIAL